MQSQYCYDCKTGRERAPFEDDECNNDSPTGQRRHVTGSKIPFFISFLTGPETPTRSQRAVSVSRDACVDDWPAVCSHGGHGMARILVTIIPPR